MTEQGEEAGNRESLVAVAEDFKVDSVAVKSVGYKGDYGIDGYHEEDADDAAHERLAACTLELRG